MKKNKGITLVALVVTIIILIILAGIGINLAMGENGIMKKAKTAQKRQDIARIYEKLEMEKGEIAIDNDFTATVKQYVEQIKKREIIKEEDPENKVVDEWNIDLGSCYIKVEGKYYFKIEQDEENEGNVKITYIENPLILELKEKVTTNEIEVKVTAINAKEYEYFIQKEGEERKSKGKKKEETYTYEGLEQGKRYWIEVEVTGESGEKVRLGKWIKTITVEDLTTTNTTFTYNPNDWTNGNVVATASTTVTGFTLQTSKDGVNWSNSASQTYEENGVVYARVVDSTGQEGGSTTGNVDKIDKTKPVVTSATANTNTITIKATDEASGIIGYTVTSNTTVPTSFTSCNNTKSLSVSIENKKQGTTYYVWIKDAVGNISNYKEIKTANVPKGNITFSYSPNGWTNGSVVATASTTVTGYTLQTSKDGVNWSLAASQTYSTNGTIYARLVDSTGQEGGSTTGNINKIDKTAPTKPSINLNGYTSGSYTPANVTITASSTDSQSGIAYYQYTHDGTNVVNIPSNPWTINWDGEWNFYIRAVDQAGNVGAWSDIFTVRRLSKYYIYNAGNTYSHITGGWRGVHVSSSYINSSGLICNFNSSYMHMRNVPEGSFALATANKVTIPSNYTKMCVQLRSAAGGPNKIRFGYAGELPSANGSQYYPIYATDDVVYSSDAWTTVSAAIGGAAGNSYYWFVRDDHAWYGIHVYAVWFE